MELPNDLKSDPVVHSISSLFYECWDQRRVGSTDAYSLFHIFCSFRLCSLNLQIFLFSGSLCKIFNPGRQPTADRKNARAENLPAVKWSGMGC